MRGYLPVRIVQFSEVKHHQTLSTVRESRDHSSIWAPSSFCLTKKAEASLSCSVCMCFPSLTRCGPARILHLALPQHDCLARCAPSPTSTVFRGPSFSVPVVRCFLLLPPCLVGEQQISRWFWMTVGRFQKKKGAPRSHSTQRHGNSALQSAQCPGSSGTPGPCLSDGAPVIFCHLTRLALCPAHCLARIVALWMGEVDHGSDGSSLQFASWVPPRTRPKERALAGPGHFWSTWRAWLALGVVGHSVSNPASPQAGRLPRQKKSQSVPVTKLPPPPFFASLVSLFHIVLSLAPRLTTDDLKIPGADDNGKRTYPIHPTTKTILVFLPARCTIHQHQARAPSSCCCTLRLDCILTHTTYRLTAFQSAPPTLSNINKQATSARTPPHDQSLQPGRPRPLSPASGLLRPSTKGEHIPPKSESKILSSSPSVGSSSPTNEGRLLQRFVVVPLSCRQVSVS